MNPYHTTKASVDVEQQDAMMRLITERDFLAEQRNAATARADKLQADIESIRQAFHDAAFWLNQPPVFDDDALAAAPVDDAPYDAPQPQPQPTAPTKEEQLRMEVQYVNQMYAELHARAIRAANARAKAERSAGVLGATLGILLLSFLAFILRTFNSALGTPAHVTYTDAVSVGIASAVAIVAMWKFSRDQLDIDELDQIDDI